MPRGLVCPTLRCVASSMNFSPSDLIRFRARPRLVARSSFRLDERAVRKLQGALGGAWVIPNQRSEFPVRVRLSPCRWGCRRISAGAPTGTAGAFGKVGSVASYGAPNGGRLSGSPLLRDGSRCDRPSLVLRTLHTLQNLALGRRRCVAFPFAPIADLLQIELRSGWNRNPHHEHRGQGRNPPNSVRSALFGILRLGSRWKRPRRRRGLLPAGARRGRLRIDGRLPPMTVS